MEWEKAKEVKIWWIEHRKPPNIPDEIIEKVSYKFINSGLLISNENEGCIDFIPNHKIDQIKIVV